VYKASRVTRNTTALLLLLPCPAVGAEKCWDTEPCKEGWWVQLGTGCGGGRLSPTEQGHAVLSRSKTEERDTTLPNRYVARSEAL
jgi:hypothetical protein